MKALKRGFTVVVPVYNSSGILRELVKRLKPALESLNLDYELILINDGSRDDSWRIIEELTQSENWIRGIDMMRNFGQHNAILAGIRNASLDTIITMDDDLQHPPEELLKLVNKFNEGYAVVYGSPVKEQHGLWRDLASLITKIALQSAMGAKTARLVSAWRIFRTDLRNAFSNFYNPFVSVDVLLTWGTTKFGAIALRHEARYEGKSNYTFGKLLRHALNMMTGFSVLPLQMASIIGFAFTVFGVAILLYVIIVFLLHGSTVSGFPFLASIISIFAGAQLFALGMIGEYLARMHFRLMDKPPFVIQKKSNFSQEEI